jgi:uncharacterized glyoxalase superfamily protein PhnB
MANARSALTSAVFYRDPRAALRFLEEAFGFELAMLIEDGDGNLVHSEMRLDNALIMIGPEFTKDHQSPLSVGGKNTQTVHIHIATEADAHCRRARAAGFEILAEPETQFYGDRTYRCRDPEGHIWTIGQTVREMSREEAADVSGLKITGWV